MFCIILYFMFLSKNWVHFLFYFLALDLEVMSYVSCLKSKITASSLRAGITPVLITWRIYFDFKNSIISSKNSDQICLAALSARITKINPVSSKDSIILIYYWKKAIVKTITRLLYIYDIMTHFCVHMWCVTSTVAASVRKRLTLCFSIADDLKMEFWKMCKHKPII